MWQNFIVIVAVSAAALYVFWSLAPKSFRSWVANRWGGRITWLARYVDQSSCADCAVRNNTRSSR
jgi:hypothetical protein